MKTLAGPVPRFLGRARALDGNGTAQFDLLFDATEIEQANCCCAVVEFDRNIGDHIRGMMADPVGEEVLRSKAWSETSRFLE